MCSIIFWTYPSFVKAGEGFLCGKKCKYEWIAKKYKGKKSKAGFRNSSLKKICKWCNIEFITFKSQNRIFHNKDCYNKWFKKYKVGKDAIRWIDGSSFLPYGPGFTRRLKREIKERDNFTCQNCGTKENLSIHHINYNKNDNSKENLITYCMICNIKDIKLNKLKYI